jgi:two-component system, OmpR family, sensor histidine kinase MtrB
VLKKFASYVLEIFRRSIQLRYVTATVVLSAMSLIAVGGFLSYSIGNGLFQTRIEQILRESQQASSEVQKTFSASGNTDSVSLQTLVNEVIPNLE